MDPRTPPQPSGDPATEPAEPAGPPAPETQAEPEHASETEPEGPDPRFLIDVF